MVPSFCTGQGRKSEMESPIGTLRAGTSQSMDQPQGAIGLAAAREFLFNAFPATASFRVCGAALRLRCPQNDGRF